MLLQIDLASVLCRIASANLDNDTDQTRGKFVSPAGRLQTMLEKESSFNVFHRLVWREV